MGAKASCLVCVSKSITLCTSHICPRSSTHGGCSQLKLLHSTLVSQGGILLAQVFVLQACIEKGMCT